MSDEEWIPGSKSELMSAISREWNFLMEAVAKLERSDKMTTPNKGGWSLKDNLAHITEWMIILMDYLIWTTVRRMRYWAFQKM